MSKSHARAEKRKAYFVCPKVHKTCYGGFGSGETIDGGIPPQEVWVPTTFENANNLW